ncbi:hypothetical protein GUJ93_ZPchr0011g28042 [Zizania palustris]|uniref:Uncharacterized protein n=1 Tax=Zizania palustris TaxID=103762 RepID=A0A8J6BUL0_ZIZPA|nr:hypothetical protein GUJ93_ZPchr0011g28042 [Zizania palustris]
MMAPCVLEEERFLPKLQFTIQVLAVLYLSENEMVGPIPSILGNLSYTAELGKLEELFELNLANNNLQGPIPANIGSCTALNKFNVYGNKLNGLFLPVSRSKIRSEFGRIINLDTLDLSYNEFSGPVRATISDLEHLLELNLSKNHLDGSIPAEFGNLKSVQVIDMSNNNLSGSLPEELGQLQNLDSLILNNNNLVALVIC